MVLWNEKAECGFINLLFVCKKVGILSFLYTYILNKNNKEIKDEGRENW